MTNDGILDTPLEGAESAQDLCKRFNLSRGALYYYQTSGKLRGHKVKMTKPGAHGYAMYFVPEEVQKLEAFLNTKNAWTPAQPTAPTPVREAPRRLEPLQITAVDDPVLGALLAVRGLEWVDLANTLGLVPDWQMLVRQQVGGDPRTLVELVLKAEPSTAHSQERRSTSALTDAREQIEALDAALRERDEQIDTMNDDITRSRVKLAELESALQKAQSASATDRERQLIESRDQHAQNASAKQREINEISQLLHIAERERDDAQTEMERLKKLAARLESEIATARNELRERALSNGHSNGAHEPVAVTGAVMNAFRLIFEPGRHIGDGKHLAQKPQDVDSVLKLLREHDHSGAGYNWVSNNRELYLRGLNDKFIDQGNGRTLGPIV